MDWAQGIFVFIVATIAMLLFAAATQGWFLARNRIYETVALLLIAFTLFRPGFWMDMIAPPFESVPPAQIEAAALAAPVGSDLRLEVDGVNAVGDPVSFTALLPVMEGETGADRITAAGLTLLTNGDEVIIDGAAFGSAAAEAGFDWDQKIKSVLAPVEAPSKYWMFIPALILLAGVVMLQRGRAAKPKPATA